jgi:hypothetical protein
MVRESVHGRGVLIMREKTATKLQCCLMLALLLALSACTDELPEASPSGAAPLTPAGRAARAAGGDSARCPLRAADIDKLSPYRWEFAQYQADRGFFANHTIRIDFCELIGRDDKGAMRSGVMVNIASGPSADAFAKHWHAVCADSLMPEARGKVQPVPGVRGGYQCVTANGSSSAYWLEAEGRTIQIEPEDEGAEWEKMLPQLLAAAK